ncbi:MAG: hypothetical protein OSB41_09010 [Kiritimatiellae bacterium]|nr:hypothetical protein [Kiritimatiellia bacterium]
MTKASDLKRGNIVNLNGAPCILEAVMIQTPSARGGASIYKLRFRNVVTKQKEDRSCKGDEAFEDVAFEVPAVVELEISETGPSIKGASATSRTKPATLSTGFIVQVPEYLCTGETVRIDTSTGKFLSRA